MLCLWLYGTLQAVGSARALARLAETHDAYRWICGGVTVNHHTLSASVQRADGQRHGQPGGLVGVQVISRGSDAGRLVQMLGQFERVHGRLPRAVLADGGFVALDDVQRLEERGVAVLMPPPEPRRPKGAPKDMKLRSRYAPLAEDTAQIGRWRRRMGRAVIGEIYKERAATAECVNALARMRGLVRFSVRGLARVKAAALWYALAHNLKRAISLKVLDAMAAQMQRAAA